MKEDFIHYLWKFKKFDFLKAKTTAGDEIYIRSSGMHNTQKAGPDFFNAQLDIGTQHWAGNVEVHQKSSDWFAHNHHTDSAYDNVILHVVWEHDVEVYRNNNTPIPTLVIANYIDDKLLENYHQLFTKKETKFINCASYFPNFNSLKIDFWLTKLYAERLENKAVYIEKLLAENNFHWEQTLFCMLAKYFGLKQNATPFIAIAQSVPFAMLQKETQAEKIEALLFGQAGLLEETKDDYQKKLQREYQFLKTKFKCSPIAEPVHFFRLRPLNFPTVRLAQLASLYTKQKNLFSQLIQVDKLEDFYQVLSVKTSPYWETHYNFGKTSKFFIKKTSKKFINLLLINAVFPLQFVYGRAIGKPFDEKIFEFLKQLPPENNHILTQYHKLHNNLGNSAMHSQALLQMYTEYCTKNKCLLCTLGNQVL
ncbi:hypothetical protein GGR32_000876 [Mesonia hippocampi]|uniref:DUF2851 family protein n=1 Tax=Mesonia hippocampi TaxID=1628250 RepID=A0A840ET54_9FLAO|nr:DUF2851 family protein [Mesonia hippocampi]MBB4118596.1 hypothetical protein [Mesonia hippocampi]